jgi:hypothetical protein
MQHMTEDGKTEQEETQGQMRIAGGAMLAFAVVTLAACVHLLALVLTAIAKAGAW